MEGRTDLDKAASVFGSNFIGPESLSLFSKKIGVEIPSHIPDIPYDLDFLLTKKNDHLLFLSASKMITGVPITLLSLRDFFGIDPSFSEPCFYNQDWYINEAFANEKLYCSWNLIRKEVFEESRAINPDLLSEMHKFPPAVLCAYIFFLYFSVTGQYLWKNDYVWCKDRDHNNDRIYVGRYSDSAGIKKNGFEIHRHLSLKPSYGAINYY
jgi:hypothetical protein